MLATVSTQHRDGKAGATRGMAPIVCLPPDRERLLAAKLEMQAAHVSCPSPRRVVEAFELVHSWGLMNWEPERASARKLSITEMV